MEHLRSAGHDVTAVADALAEDAPDHQVLERASDEGRVLLTNDKDFGELAFLQREATSGILLLRMPSLDTAGKIERVDRAVTLLGRRLADALTVVTEKRIRRRPFPADPF